MSSTTTRFRNVRLQTLLFAFLALFGILPILLNSAIGIVRNKAFFEREEKIDLSRQAEELSERFGALTRATERELDSVAAGIEALPAGLEESEREPWLQQQIQGFVGGTSGEFIPYVVEVGERERAYRANNVPSEVHRGAVAVINAARSGAPPRYSFVAADSGDAGPWVIVSRGVEGVDGTTRFVLLSALAVPLRGSGEEEIFLIDRDSKRVLWSSGSRSAPVEDAVERSDTVREALEMTGGFPVLEYDVRVGSATRRMIGQLSALGSTGWTVLVQKRERAALAATGTMVRNAALTAALTVVLALVLGGLASRALSQPIQALAETSHEIAAGRFGQHVTASGPGTELHDLAESFNTMSDQVQDYVVRLRKAARDNRDLFTGSIRALLRAVEAKEPYTRGHSERVASYSQMIARHLHQGREFEDEMWIAGLLHDVGKIGIEDRILNKGDVLTDAEFEEMRRHPMIGAQIMSSIEALRPVLPAIRWHHERWGGGGYPDGLVGKEIPLMARVVAVADTFDAVTTQRVYQDPYTPEEAVAIIDKLDGVNFDPEVVRAFHRAIVAGEVAGLAPESGELPIKEVEEYEPVHT